MLTKRYLEQLIMAWPNESGKSSDQEFFDAWIERERRYNGRIIQNALGLERILCLTSKQKVMLESVYAELLLKRDITDISDEEIIGQYELITEHISPTSVERVVDAYKRKQKLN